MFVLIYVCTIIHRKLQVPWAHPGLLNRIRQNCTKSLPHERLQRISTQPLGWWMPPLSNGADEPSPMLTGCSSSLILTSLVLFWASRLFSLMTIQSAKASMTAPWPQSPNITANKKGKVMIVYGAAGRKGQEAQLLLNFKTSAEKQSTPLDHSLQLLPLKASTIPPYSPGNQI